MTGWVDLGKWNQLFQEHYSLVALDNEIIVGFGDIDKTSYLDRLYVHAEYQGKGIDTAICNQLEQAVFLTNFVMEKVMESNVSKQS